MAESVGEKEVRFHLMKGFIGTVAHLKELDYFYYLYFWKSLKSRNQNRKRVTSLFTKGFPSGSNGKASACSAGDPDSILGWEDPLEKETATHSSTLAWKIAWTEDPGGLQGVA